MKVTKILTVAVVGLFAFGAQGAQFQTNGGDEQWTGHLVGPFTVAHLSGGNKPTRRIWAEAKELCSLNIADSGGWRLPTTEESHIMVEALTTKSDGVDFANSWVAEKQKSIQISPNKGYYTFLIEAGKANTVCIGGKFPSAARALAPSSSPRPSTHASEPPAPTPAVAESTQPPSQSAAAPMRLSDTPRVPSTPKVRYTYLVWVDYQNVQTAPNNTPAAAEVDEVFNAEESKQLAPFGHYEEVRRNPLSCSNKKCWLVVTYRVRTEIPPRAENLTIAGRVRMGPREKDAEFASTSILDTPPVQLDPAQTKGALLAFCFENKAAYWFCDGRLQETTSGDKSIDAQLSTVGCETPRRLNSNRVILTHKSAKVGNKEGWLFVCRSYYDQNGVDVTMGGSTRNIRKWWEVIDW